MIGVNCERALLCLQSITEDLFEGCTTWQCWLNIVESELYIMTTFKDNICFLSSSDWLLVFFSNKENTKEAKILKRVLINNLWWWSQTIGWNSKNRLKRKIEARALNRMFEEVKHWRNQIHWKPPKQPLSYKNKLWQKSTLWCKSSKM